MKKIFTFTFILFFSTFSLAKEVVRDFPDGAEYRKQLLEKQDEMLNFLLQTPMEMRQYIFPMLNEKQSVSKKIKTHPEIIIWKGKKPTKIVKKFQNDPELLEYLPAQFYYYLAPEMWPDEISQNQNLEANPNQVFLNFVKTPSTDHFSSEELIHFKKALSLLSENLTQNQKKILTEKGQPIYLEKLFILPNRSLEEKLQSEGYFSLKDFTQKVDKIAFIYRQYKSGKMPNASGEEETFVKEYFSLIPMLYKNSNFENLLDNKAYSD